MSNEITLPVGATAEPDTCGSCKFFARRDDGQSPTQGECFIKLPPVIADKYYVGKEAVENSWQFMRTTDTARCDFQRPDGKVYIVQRRVPPETRR